MIPLSRRCRRRNPAVFFGALEDARKTGEKLHGEISDFAGAVLAVSKAGEGLVDHSIQHRISKIMGNLQEAAAYIKGARHRLDDIATGLGVE